MSKSRPKLDSDITIHDFKSYYWLKEELVKYCLAKGISTSGGKIEIASRIEEYLATGIISKPIRKSKKLSTFDWKNAPIFPETIITDNYKNSENVRNFMTQYIGKHFRFNTEFMSWANHNEGKTLKDAINEWQRIYTQKKDKNYKTELNPQFEYNKYIRDFIADNPGCTMKEAINCWNKKRNEKGGRVYSPKNNIL
jgi:hypothetical protein